MGSIRQRLFIMKLHANVYHVNKQPSLEEGPLRYETTDQDCNSTGNRKSNRCNRCLKLIKVILYLELILFISWIGSAFLTEYYETHEPSGQVEPYGASKWSQDADSLGSVMESNPVSLATVGSLPEQDEGEITTVKTTTHKESGTENQHVTNDIEWTTATNGIKPDNTGVELILLSHRLESLTFPENTRDDSSSESASSENKLGWGTFLTRISSLQVNMDGALSNENDFGGKNEYDEKELEYLLLLSLWHDGIFTYDYLEEIVDPEEDSLQAGVIANATFALDYSDSTEHHRSRRVRSTTEQEEDCSSSSSIEKSSSTCSELHHASLEASDEDDLPTIFGDDGYVIDESKEEIDYVSRNWVHWLEESDIPECGKSKVPISVTVDEHGKFIINCVIDGEQHSPMRHYRYTRNVEKNNAAEEDCKQLAAVFLQDLRAWTEKFVVGESSVEDVRIHYQDIDSHFSPYIFELIIQKILNRISGGQHTTNQEGHNSSRTMKGNISELMDTQHPYSLVNSSELTLEEEAELGKIVETGVDIYMNCHDVSSTPPEIQIFTILLELGMCFEISDKIKSMEDRFAAEIVPGESTNLETVALRQKFHENMVVLIINMMRNGSGDYGPVFTNPFNLTNEQWATHMLGLKQEMAELTEDTALREQLSDAASLTQEQTNQLREIADHYLVENKQCRRKSILEFTEDSKMRRTRSVVTDPELTPTIVTCTLEDDDVQFALERQDRFDGYNQSAAVSIIDLTTRPFLNAIEEKLNGITPTENADEELTPSFVPYMNAFDVFVGNTSTDLKNEGYRLLRDIALELTYLDDNETETESYNIDRLVQNWTSSCLMHIPGNFTAETILMAVIKAGEALNLHYSGVEDGKKCGDEFTPVYGTFTYLGEAPEKSIVRRWRHIFRGIVRLYFKIHNPEVVPKLHCVSNKAKFQTEKLEVDVRMNRLEKRSIGNPI